MDNRERYSMPVWLQVAVACAVVLTIALYVVYAINPDAAAACASMVVLPLIAFGVFVSCMD
jgi:hypothetical protein